MTIQKRYRGQIDPTWKTVTEEEFLATCLWQKDTALQTLKDAGQFSTPWADFRIVQQGGAA